MKLVITAIMALLSYAIFGQSLQITNIAVSPDGIVSFKARVTPDHSPRERYKLVIFTSKDDFREPIDFSMDDLEPQRTYDISFDGNEQISKWRGDLQLKFDVIADAFPIKTNVDPNQSFKIGKSYFISWDDFHSAGSYDVELYRRTSLVQVLADNHNGTSLSGEMPESLQKGDDYEIRIKPSSGDGSASDPIPVRITKGVGLAVKLAPLAAVGIAVPVFLLGGGDGGGTGPTTGDDQFEAPPGPPGGG